METPCDCGHVALSDGLGTGYALTRDGRKLCYACADDQQRDELATLPHGQAFSAYVSSDGQHITTWSGGQIARVVSLTAGRISPTAKGVYVKAAGPSGRYYYGRGAGCGMYVTLRPYK